MRPRKKVILVDSDEQRLSERTFLLRNKGYNVYPCELASSAIELLGGFQQGELDLFIANESLTDSDGNELCKRSKDIHPLLPTLLMYNSINELKDCAANNFISNSSYSTSHFISMVKILIARKRGPRPKIKPMEVVLVETGVSGISSRVA
jgi:response regulator RpfG family c-di-GMP phosphodiesterase